jgi:hypothetical protein
MASSDSASTATVGLLGGHGLNLGGVPALLSQLAASPFISEAIIAINNSGDTTLGSTTLPGITSTIPSFITNIGTGLGITIYTNQFNTLTNSGSIIGFISNLMQIYGFATLCSGTADEMMNSLVLNTLGLPATKNSLAYVTTTGFSSLITTPNSTNIGLFASDLANTGTIYSLSDLTNLGSPGSIYSALLTANIPGALNAQTSLTNAGVNLDDLTNSLYQSNIKTALMGINSSTDLAAIFSAFNIAASIQPTITNASVFTTLQPIFPQSYNLLKPGSSGAQTFTNMGTLLGAINLSSSYNTFADIATFLQGITYPPNYNSTCTINTSVTPDILYAFASSVGAGTAIGGTLSVKDFLNPVDPTLLTPLINTMLDNSTYLVNTTQGAALQALIIQLQTATTLTIPTKATVEAEIEAALLALLQGTSLASQYAIAINTAWTQMMSILSISKYALTTSGVSLPSSAITSTTVVMGFGSTLSSFGQDPYLLGTGALLSNLTTSDIYGAAIQAAINLASSNASSTTNTAT